MKQVLDLLKGFHLLTIYLYFDSDNGSRLVYKRSYCMTSSLHAMRVMISERERVSMSLPFGFDIRTAFTNLFDNSYDDILNKDICECASDFRFIFKEVQRSAFDYINV